MNYEPPESPVKLIRTLLMFLGVILFIILICPNIPREWVELILERLFK